MKHSSWNISVLALLLAAATVVVVVRAQQPAADFLLTNGKIITVDDRFIIAQAVAFRGDRIVAVGTNQDVARLASRSAAESGI